MPSTTVIAATTDQVTAKQPFNTHGLTFTVAAVAAGLQNSEKVYVWVGTSNGWVQMYENDSAVVMTATAPQVSLLPGMNYGFTKDATAAPVAVDVMVTR